MEHLLINGTDNLFVLFHGTGGNESNLLFLTGELDSHASVISFLGNVVQNYTVLLGQILNAKDTGVLILTIV